MAGTRLAGLALAAVLLAACGQGGSNGPLYGDTGPSEQTGGDDGGLAAGGGAAGSCIAALKFDGQMYEGHAVNNAPEVGETLGDATFPPCNDTPGSSEEATTSAVAAIKGVDPDRAIVVVAQARDMVWVKAGTGLPESLEGLMARAKCEDEGAFTLEGDWLGIPDPGTDLVPPYRLQMYVTKTSPGSEQYQDSQLSVRVNDETKNPVTKQDVKTSLWEGGSMRADVHCNDGAFIADDLAFFPPE